MLSPTQQHRKVSDTDIYVRAKELQTPICRGNHEEDIVHVDDLYEPTPYTDTPSSESKYD